MKDLDSNDESDDENPTAIILVINIHFSHL